MLHKMDENHYLWKTRSEDYALFIQNAAARPLLAAACGNPAATPFEPAPDAVVIPFQGNVFVTETPGSFYGEAPRIIDTRNSRLQSWNDPATVLSLYFRTEGKGNLHLAFQATQPAGTESNEFAFTCNGIHPQGPRDRPRNL